MQVSSLHALSMPTGFSVLRVLPHPLTTRLCLWMVATLQLPADYDMEPIAQAQALIQRGAVVIHALRRGHHAGDVQAVEAYQSGVAVGFYGLERNCLPASHAPVAGSVWQPSQLRQLRSIGLAHGATVRRHQFGEGRRPA